MKKKLMIAVSILFLVGAMLTSCRKESAQSASSNQTNNLQVGNNSSCKLTHNVWAYWYTWDFHYNDKGLADEWKIDFGGGYFWNFKMEYDNFNKLVEADGYDPDNNLIIITTFKYDGNRIISQAWQDLVFGANSDVRFSHNSKGQIVQVDDIINDTHVFVTYDNMGNSTRSDYYIGSDIYYSDIYEFNVNVRNPLLTVSGVDWLFPYYGAGYFNKLWFSRNLSIVYDVDGTPYVINDFDASKTDFSIGSQDFPTAANYYDTVSQGPLDFAFGYSCDGESNIANQDFRHSNSAIGINQTNKGPMMLTASGKSIKEQINELRDQIKNNQLRKYEE